MGLLFGSSQKLWVRAHARCTLDVERQTHRWNKLATRVEDFCMPKFLQRHPDLPKPLIRERILDHMGILAMMSGIVLNQEVLEELGK